MRLLTKILFAVRCTLGYDPTALEWDRKLWWPVNEAMIAFLLAHKMTGEEKYWDGFKKVTDYCYEKASVMYE